MTSLENNSNSDRENQDGFPSFWQFLQKKLEEDREALGVIIKNPIAFLQWVREDVAQLLKNISKQRN